VAIPFVYVRAQGSYREIGRQVGEAAREQIQASLAFFADNFAAMSGGLEFGAAERQAAAYLRYARACTPQAVEELEGMAEGAGVPASALLVPNCGEEFTSSEPVAGAQPLSPGCTAVAVVSGGRHIVGHNMNSHGIANVSNSVHSTDNRLGIPNAFVRRSTMEAATLETAHDRGLPAARARGTNQFFADAGGRLWDIESSATASALADHSARGYMAHTNHYVAPEMAPFEGSHDPESRTRLGTAERMLAAGLDHGDDPVELVARVLRCHEPTPRDCICGHPEPGVSEAEQGMTVGSIICDLDERRLHVCAGPPCEADYQAFAMD